MKIFLLPRLSSAIAGLYVFDVEVRLRELVYARGKKHRRHPEVKQKMIKKTPKIVELNQL